MVRCMSYEQLPDEWKEWLRLAEARERSGPNAG